MEKNSNNKINVIKYSDSVENGSISKVIINQNSEASEKTKKEEIKNEIKIEIKNEIKNETKNEINKIYFFISEFGFILMLGFILIIIYLSPQYHPAKTFTSKKSKTLFNSDFTPKIFIHTTDIHVSVSVVKRLDGTLIFLTSLLEYKPDLFLMTGDLILIIKWEDKI